MFQTFFFQRSKCFDSLDWKIGVPIFFMTDLLTVYKIVKWFNENGVSVGKKECPKDCSVLKLTKPIYST